MFLEALLYNYGASTTLIIGKYLNS